MLRRLLVYQLVLRNISVNVKTSIGLSIILRYISVNREACICLSISFEMHKR